MEDRTEDPMAVKVEKHSQYIILTYFHGDANSMVDAHFSRALGSACRDKGPAGQAKKTRKSIKSGKKARRQTGPPTLYGVSVHREIQPVSGVCCGRLLQATAPTRRPPDLKPYRRRPRLVAPLHSQRRRGHGAAVHRVLPVPGRTESHRTAIRDVASQPTAQRTGRHGAQSAVQLQAGAASQLDGAAGPQRASGPRHGFQTW